MKAIQVYEFGAPKVMRYEEIDVPVCAEGQVRVKVAAAAVNPIDYKIREGSHLVCPSLQLPSGLGFDFSGEVVECADAVTGLAPGDQVIGIAGFPFSPCSYQEELIVNAEHCLKVAGDVDLPALAGLPLAGLTAWQAVHRHGKLQSGQKVLVHAAAGGVGTFVVQLAKAVGAEVYVTASEPKHEVLKSLGADHCIDYRQGPFFEQLGKTMDVVIDLVGAQVGVDSLKALKEDGLLVTVPSFSKDEVLAAAEAVGIAAEFFLMDYDLGELQQLAERVVRGGLEMVIGGRYPLSEAQTAHQQIEGGRTLGKLLLIP